MPYILIIFSSLFGILASIILKNNAGKPIRFDDIYLILNYLFALIAYGFGFIFYAASLRYIELSIAYPLMVAMSVVGVLLYSYLFGQESITALRLLGALSIMFGVFLISK